MFKRAALASLVLLGTAAQATSLSLSADGSWIPFDVNPDLAASVGSLGWIDAGTGLGGLGDGTALTFTFTVPADQAVVLNVVDGGFAGDRFTFLVNGTPVVTSAVANSYPASVGTDFDAAFASGAYSKSSLVLGAGTYVVTGTLSTSALDDAGSALNVTVGALQLAPVPEPEAVVSLLAGLAVLGALRHRRAA